MDIQIERFRSLCELKEFKINGIEAVNEDFGEKRDRNEHDAPIGGCGDMRFTSVPPSKQVLARYRITNTDYYQICAILAMELSFGLCSRCR